MASMQLQEISFGKCRPGRRTFWPLCWPYLSTAAISLSSLYARALGTMLCRSSWLGACSDSARLTPGKSSLSCASSDTCEHVTATDVLPQQTKIKPNYSELLKLQRSITTLALLKKSTARTDHTVCHTLASSGFILRQKKCQPGGMSSSAERIRRLQKPMTKKAAVWAAQLGHLCSHNRDTVHTCRMRGMMPTVEMVTLERFSPNSAGWTIMRVAVRTCS